MKTLPKKHPQKNNKHPDHIPLHPLMKKLRAFTLVELMIAMAIIAILATAGLQAYTGYTKKSRDTARAEMARNLNSAVMSYAASNNGLPPANAAAFDAFVRSAGEVFQGGAVSTENRMLIKDPVGGKDVCLDADGNADEPCAFHYTAYDDGTYAISYGVEHESSTKENFYKTTNSITDPNNTANTIEKYGVYIGSAPYIGSLPPTTPTNYTAVDPIETVSVVYRSQRIDIVPIESGGSGTMGGDGEACGVTTCNSGQGCQNNVCQDLCGNQLCTDMQECVNEACVDPILCLGRGIGELCAGGAMYAGSDYMVTPSHTFGVWSSALTYCANLEFGGFTDWYLPNVDELSNVLYSNRVALGLSSDQYWSSTDVGPTYGYSSHDPNFSMIVWMYNGTLYSQGKNGGSAFRCIRGTGEDSCGLCTAEQQCVEGICEDLCGEGILCTTGQLCIDNTCVNSCGGVACTAEQQCVNNVCINSCGGVFCTAEQQCVNNVCMNPDPCGQPSATAGTICTDGTVYVTSTIRTTPSDSSSGSGWATQNIITGANNANYGSSNTTTLATLGSGYGAAKVCADLSFGGHDDWYLPARWELNTLYFNRGAIGGFTNSSSYWSSTEHSSTNAWRHYFAINSSGDNRSKSNYYRVRCIRTP